MGYIIRIIGKYIVLPVMKFILCCACMEIIVKLFGLFVNFHKHDIFHLSIWILANLIALAAFIYLFYKLFIKGFIRYMKGLKNRYIN